MKLSRILVILGFVVIGVMSRLIPHPPNFTALNAMALFGAFYFGSRSVTLGVVLSTLLISDLFLGNHTTLPFVYISFILIMAIGYSLKERLAAHLMLLVGVGTSLLFFLVTNFGSWMTNAMYPKTMQGLALCYTAALPFLTHQLMGDLLYGALFLGLLFGVDKVRALSNSTVRS